MHYFRGGFVWMGYQGPTQRINETWPGLTGPIDAAFRNHNEKNPLEHQRIYLFKGAQVWSYYEGQLVTGFPRLISEAFPGIPDKPDAAVECHRGECRTDSAIFFKGDTVYIYRHDEKPAVQQRRWAGLGTCTAAARWKERYYCFNGINFTQFNPVTGQVLSPRPLDSRDYFIRCPGRGNKLTLVDLNTRKCSGEDQTIIHAELDAAMCNSEGLYLFYGPSFYHYKNVEELLSSKVAPSPGSIASHFLDC
ncbi:hypothetical protein GDO78_019797 [Eleutherodactylus coqui]|uniref:Hemopexin n=1 Tax=Eleutherodactylus coqui TaxID=57060 RepID=A0A8J6B7E9_ELECQ|nr:hypothetical protein GDO78_019797 [Eleutherodactylus coqui]